MIKNLILSAILITGTLSHAAMSVTIPTNADEAGEMIESSKAWLDKLDTSFNAQNWSKTLELLTKQIQFEALADAEFHTKLQAHMLPIQFPGDQLFMPVSALLAAAIFKSVYKKKTPVMTPEELQTAEFNPSTLREFKRKIFKLEAERAKLVKELRLKYDSTLPATAEATSDASFLMNIEGLTSESQPVISKALEENLKSLVAVDAEIQQVVRPSVFKRTWSGFGSALRFVTFGFYAYFGFDMVRTSFGVYYMQISTKDAYNWRLKLNADIQRLRSELEEAGAFN